MSTPLLNFIFDLRVCKKVALLGSSPSIRRLSIRLEISMATSTWLSLVLDEFKVHYIAIGIYDVFETGANFVPVILSVKTSTLARVVKVHVSLGY